MKRALPIVTLAAVALLATACTNGEDPEDSLPSAGEVTEAATAEPEFDPNEANWMTFFDTLEFPLIGQEWEVISLDEQAYYSVQMTSYTSCTESIRTRCPKLAFERLDAFPDDHVSSISTADDPTFALIHAQCTVGEDTLREIIETDEVLIGGKVANHLRLDQCPLEMYQEGGQFVWYPRQGWYIEENSVMIWAEDTSGGAVDTDALEMAFLHAKWL